MTEAAQLENRREKARERMAAHRDRRRQGRILVSVEVSREHLAALERLGLLDMDADKLALAWAVSRYLDTARHVAGLGDALYPEREGREAA
jgi:hypothetical protein